MREFVRNYLINRKVLFNIPFLILVLFCLWLATRPYPGYYGDARLYLLQALARLDPVAFSDDLFVRYGSQDNFSVFGGILAFAISTVGLHSVRSSGGRGRLFSLASSSRVSSGVPPRSSLLFSFLPFTATR